MKQVNKNEMSIIYSDEKLSSIKKVYGEYHNSQDITIIFEDIINKETKDIISIEIKGFYFGEPNIEDIEKFYGDLKAEL